ncbi:hypothetical protein BpHYR1_027719 [Brachionus plicatilis]|uniref:Uncharacterized protein n=1 Tax=Brachionus plicatilis TaxID=10195 RepID=A0A3M7SL10_BRAPC|nr:hypothetical protein BpHYR1_027719 [Brachionus plicatilis]
MKRICHSKYLLVTIDQTLFFICNLNKNEIFQICRILLILGWYLYHAPKPQVRKYTSICAQRFTYKQSIITWFFERSRKDHFTSLDLIKRSFKNFFLYNLIYDTRSSELKKPVCSKNFLKYLLEKNYALFELKIKEMPNDKDLNLVVGFFSQRHIIKLYLAFSLGMYLS